MMKLLVQKDQLYLAEPKATTTVAAPKLCQDDVMNDSEGSGEETTTPEADPQTKLINEWLDIVKRIQSVVDNQAVYFRQAYEKDFEKSKANVPIFSKFQVKNY
ncbi:hypothetical protein Ddc_16800 [Ditylenchus destructor]|nr:hypothetical protein Ddc_16800 [Ditylenchus destructor]